MTLRLFLIAGEPSGDRLGAALMAGMKQIAPQAEFHGIGGPAMQAEGLVSLFPMAELSIMGLAEVLPHIRSLLARIRQTAAAVTTLAPDALITIDSPDFCLRVAKKVKAAAPEVKTIHYVAPSVWAWRPHRAAKMAKMIDHVLALLPFEPPYMEAAGMSCDFVGHPVAGDPVASAAEAAGFRAAHGIAADAPLILALPGSRKGEISRLAPVFGAALAPVLVAHPGARIVLPTVAPMADLVASLTRDWPAPPILLAPGGRAEADVQAEKRAAFAAADVALAASGTVSLELAAAATPMVIAYDANWLTARLVLPRLLIDTYTLVNLVSETRAVPEFVAGECRAEKIAPALLDLLENPVTQQAQRAAAETTMTRLGRGAEAPGLRAARSVLRALNRAL